LKKIFILVLFFISVHIYSFNFIEFFDASSFHYQFDSFIGTDYYPHQDNNQNRYREKSIFTAGWDFKVQDDVNIWFDLSYKKRLFDEELDLESTGIAYRKKNWTLIYKSDQLEIGNKSEIFSKNLNLYYYDNPVIEDYKFRGLEITHYLNNFYLTGILGGNSFNSAIGNLNFGYSSDNHKLDLYYLYVKRDRFFNYPMHAFGFEMISDINFFRFYNSLVYERLESNLPNDPSHERLVDLSELIFRLHPNINIGTNFLYSTLDWDKNKEWQSASFFELKIGKTINTVTYQYWNSDIGFNREINLINSYNILQYWSLGTNLSFFNPSLGDDYFVIGFQTKIEYEMD